MEKHIKLKVYKSHPLVSLTESGMSMRKLKIVDCYLAKINPNDPKSARVFLRLKELQYYLGIENYRIKDLEKDLSELMGEYVTIVYKGKTTHLKLFKNACNYKIHHNIIEIFLECSDEAMEYMFNIQKIGYIDYQIERTRKIFSIKAYRLFLKLCQNKFRKAWSWSIDVFSKILGCKPTVRDMHKCHDRAHQALLTAGINFICKISKKYDRVEISNFQQIKFKSEENKGKQKKGKQKKETREKKVISQFAKAIKYFIKNETIVHLSANEREFLTNITKTKPPPPSASWQEGREEKPIVKKYFNNGKRPLAEFEYKSWNLDDIKKIINRTSDEDEDITLEDIRGTKKYLCPD